MDAGLIVNVLADPCTKDQDCPSGIQGELSR